MSLQRLNVHVVQQVATKQTQFRLEGERRLRRGHGANNNIICYAAAAHRRQDMLPHYNCYATAASIVCSVSDYPYVSRACERNLRMHCRGGAA